MQLGVMRSIYLKLAVCCVFSFFAFSAAANHIFPPVAFSSEGEPSVRFFEACSAFSAGAVEIVSAAHVAPIDIYKSGNSGYFTHHPEFGCAGPFDLGANPKIYERYQPWFEEWVLTVGSALDGKVSITFGNTVFVVSAKMAPE